MPHHSLHFIEKSSIIIADNFIRNETLLKMQRLNTSSLAKIRVYHNQTLVLPVLIGGGAYWAGRAVARPLFGPCGPALSTARPLFCMILLL